MKALLVRRGDHVYMGDHRWLIVSEISVDPADNCIFNGQWLGESTIDAGSFGRITSSVEATFAPDDDLEVSS